MKIIKILALLFATSSIAFAGPGHPGHEHSHNHEISQTEAQQAGSTVLQKLIEKKKIDQSWTGASVVTTEKRKYANGEEWVVVFSNPQVDDDKRKNLYVFLSLHGDYVAANFSGK